MVQEDAVHSFSYCVHSTEWERKVGKTSAHTSTRKSLLKQKIINNFNDKYGKYYDDNKYFLLLYLLR